MAPAVRVRWWIGLVAREVVVFRRPVAVAAAAFAPALAAFGRVAAGCVQVRNGAASVSSGCAPDPDAGRAYGPFVAVADHPQPATAYVPVYYVPVYVPAKPAAAPTPTPVPADEARNRGQNNNNNNDREPAADDGQNDARADLQIELDCEATPETIRVTNNGDAPVTVRSVDSLVDDVAGEPFARDDVIRPGRTITYQSGEGAEGRFALGEDSLFADGDRDEGVRLETSGGEIEALCFTS